MSTTHQTWGSYLNRTGKTPRKTAVKLNPYQDPNGMAWVTDLLYNLDRLPAVFGKTARGRAIANTIKLILSPAQMTVKAKNQFVEKVIDATIAGDGCFIQLLLKTASSIPDLSPELDAVRDDPESEYHAARALIALDALVDNIGKTKKDNWLDQIGYDNLTWSTIADLAEALIDSPHCDCNGVNNPNGCPACTLTLSKADAGEALPY